MASRSPGSVQTQSLARPLSPIGAACKRACMPGGDTTRPKLHSAAVKDFPDAVAVPGDAAASLVVAAIVVVLRRARDEGRKSGQSRACSPESINEREFSEMSLRCDGTFSRGRQFTWTAREPRFPGG